MTRAGWSVVVPVKGASGKSRLARADRAELATAIALDTVDAACRARYVTEVVVVTGDADVAARVAALRPAPSPPRSLSEATTGSEAETPAPFPPRSLSEATAGSEAEAPAPSPRVVPDPGADLNAAVRAGLAALADDRPRAVLLGDLPALSPADLDAALVLAAAHSRALVPDAEGSGSTLVTALPGAPLDPAFGDDSRARHESAGFVVLDVPAGSTLRRDVDTAEQLRAAAALGLGAQTAALLRRTEADAR